MTAIKYAAEISLTFSPQSTIPYRGKPGFIVADVLGDRMNLNSGDSGALSIEGQTNPTITDDWRFRGNIYDGFFNVSSNLDFIRFLPDGRVREGSSAHSKSSDPANKDLAGWILHRREALLDCKIGSGLTDIILNAVLDTANTDLTWRALQGTWVTMRPPVAPHRCCIKNVGSDLTAKARTVGNLPANRSVRFDVHSLSKDPSGPTSAIRLGIGGNKYSVRLAHGERPTVEQNIGGLWTVLRRLETRQPISLHGGHYVVRFRRIAGRLVVGINEEHFHFIKTIQHTGRKATIKPVDDSWPAGPLTANTYNCVARIGVGTIKYCDSGGAQFVGNFSRHCPRRTPIVIPPGETLAGHATGWLRDSTTATVTTSVVSGALDYTVQMVANSDGIDTPLVNKVMVRAEPTWTTPPAVPLEVSEAVTKWSVNNAMPPIMPGANASFTINRLALESIAATAGVDWQDYVDKRCPVEFMVRWHYRDHITGAETEGDWVKLFFGYVYQITKSTDGLNRKTMTVSCRDPIMRLQKPAAVIDHRYPPLDILLFEAAAAITGQNELPVIYGSHLVYEILKIAMGPDEANQFNGNPTGDTPDLTYLLRYFDEGHYALLDNESGGYLPVTTAITGQSMTPTENGFLFMPPWGSDALDWINNTPGKMDTAMFFYGWPGGYDNLFPAPIYGRRKNILKAIHTGAGVVTLPDVIGVTGDVDRLLLSADNESRPWLEFNRVLVWSNGPMGGSAALAPAVRMAEYNLTADDPNSREQTWESTLVIREEIGWYPGIAERIGSAVLAEIAGVELQWPVLNCMGQATIQWGSIVQPVMSATGTNGNYSDAELGIDGKYFRVEKVEHEGDNEVQDFTTKIYPRPLTSGEAAELGL